MDDVFRLLPPPANLDSERDRIEATIRAVIPTGATVDEVGSTAVPGLVGKQDLDFLVTAPSARFAEVRAALDAAFDRNPDQLSTDVYQGYRVPSPLDAAIQLTVAGGPHDDFRAFLNALRRDAGLCARYAALKHAHDGRPMREYRAAKGAFIEATLTWVRAVTPPSGGTQGDEPGSPA
jgi:GrpB-like predicted nucleotidyltransferase (UPF0157 family)